MNGSVSDKTGETFIFNEMKKNVPSLKVCGFKTDIFSFLLNFTSLHKCFSQLNIRNEV